MKTIITAALLAAFVVPAFADQTSVLSGQSQATSGANNAGNAQVIQFLGGGDSTETLHAAPTVYVPSPANTIAQANCMVIPTAGASFINFGFAASIPVDGEHCDWRQNTAMELNTYANYRAYATTPGLSPEAQNAALKEANDSLAIAQDMQCLNSDRQRAIMEKMHKCGRVADLATLDHRFNQPRNYQIDYSGESQ